MNQYFKKKGEQSMSFNVYLDHTVVCTAKEAPSETKIRELVGSVEAENAEEAIAAACCDYNITSENLFKHYATGYRMSVLVAE
jgi:hypothetical protein